VVFRWRDCFCFRWYSDSSWFSVLRPADVVLSNLIGGGDTDAVLDVDLLEFAAVGVALEHGLEVGVVAFVAGSLVEDRVGEERVKAEADEEGFADLGGGAGTSELEKWSRECLLFLGRLRSRPIRLSKTPRFISILL
jgi:hypothetical protein